jgi:predicted RNA binding protein YcfA (HicA-like mRNA interferase family)
MPISGKKIIRLLLERGWSIKSQRGSHLKLVKNGKITQVPVHGNHDLGLGLIRAIEKQTGERLL